MSAPMGRGGTSRWRRFAVAGITAVLVLLVAVQLLLPRVLESTLPDLLAGIIEKPVAIESISLRPLTLEASVSRLTIGSHETPALLAEGLNVQLDGGALLRGQIRIDSADATFIRLDPGAWQSDGAGEPLDRNVVESWLPRQAQVQRLALYSGEELLSKTENNRFQTLRTDLMELSWVQQELLSPLAVRLEFSPPFAILEDRQGTIRLEVVQANNPEEILIAETTLEPAEQGAVTQRLQFTGPAVSGSWTYTADELLAWPQASALQLDRLDVDRIQDLLAEVIAEPETEPQGWLQSPLPIVALPAHAVDVRIVQLHIGDQAMRDIATRVVMQPGDQNVSASIQFQDLTARLAGADLAGNLDFALGSQWSVDADLTATSRAGSESVFENADLFWNNGHVDLVTHGTTPIKLFENARGTFAADGLYVAAEVLPLRLRANFKSERGLMGSDALELTVGDSSLVGSMWTDDSRRALNARFSSPFLDVDALRPAGGVASDTALEFEIPDQQWLPTDLPIDIQFEANALKVAGLNFADVDIGIQVSVQRALLKLSMRTGSQGSITLTAAGRRSDTETGVDLDLEVAGVDLQKLGVEVPAHITSAHLTLTGRGVSLPAIVPDLTGEVSLRLTTETLAEDIQFSAKPSFGMAVTRIASLSLHDLEISLGNSTRTRGQVRVGFPTLATTGELHTSALNLDTLILPGSETGSSAELVPLLQELVPMDLQLRFAELTLEEQAITDLNLSLRSKPGFLEIADASFTSAFGKARGQANFTANNEAADLNMEASVLDVEVSAFTDSQIKVLLDKPLMGAITLRARGTDWESLYQEARLRVQLEETPGIPDRPPEFDVDVEFKPLPGDQVQADIVNLHWRENDVRGRVTLLDVQPLVFDADLRAGFLDLTPLTEPQAAQASQEASGGLIRSFTNAAGSTLNFLTNTTRTTLSSGEAKTAAERNKLFSDEPWPIEFLDTFDADIRIVADRLTGSRVEGRDVKFVGNVGGRRVDLQIESPQVNGGPLRFDLYYDAAQSPATATVAATVEHVRLDSSPGVAPISAFVDLTAQGDSQSALAGSLNGPVYFEARPGREGFTGLGSGLLAGDLLQGIFGALLPKTDKAPQLRCAVGYGELFSGRFESPAAIVMQTKAANILVQAQADFAQETISAQFDSKSRTGTGLSVGNIFSNTVRLEGSLRDPKIVANTKSLLWRYGAAVATGGISLLGESLYKRLMADPEPCATMKTTLQSKACTPGSTLADSTLVCG